MKNLKNIVLLCTLLCGIIAFTACSSTKNASKDANAGSTKTVKLHTTAQCGSCEARIEGAVNKMTGIKTADLNVSDKVLTVKYDSAKTTPEAIKKTVLSLGYDVDGMAGDQTAYQNLPKCCQKGGHD